MNVVQEEEERTMTFINTVLLATTELFLQEIVLLGNIEEGWREATFIKYVLGYLLLL